MGASWGYPGDPFLRYDLLSWAKLPSCHSPCFTVSLHGADTYILTHLQQASFSLISTAGGTFRCAPSYILGLIVISETKACTNQCIQRRLFIQNQTVACVCVCVSRSEQGGVYENGPVGVDGAKCTTSVSLSLSFTITISHSMCDRKTISYHTVLILACLASNPKRMLTLGASSPRGAEAGTRSENNYYILRRGGY